MAKELIIKTQKELDKVKADFDGTLCIEDGERFSPIKLRLDFNEAIVIVRGQAWVQLWGNSHAVLSGNSHAVLSETSHAVLSETSHAVLWGNSHAELWGEAMVTARSAKKIVAHGYNVISVRKSNKKDMRIVVNKTSTIKLVPDFKATFANYSAWFPFEQIKKHAILYKAVHKREDGTFVSDSRDDFTYAIGETKEHPCAPVSMGTCSKGLHVAHKSWALAFGAAWHDMALLECEVPIKDIVVSKDCDGKVRTSTLKVLREVPKEEYWQ